MAEFNFTMKQKATDGSVDIYYPKTKAAQVIESDTQKFLTDVKEKQYDENTMYTNETPIVSGIGQIEVGETFDGVPVKDMLTKILYPYIKPLISGNASVATKVVEKGVTTTVTSVNAVVTKKSNPIASVALYNGGTLVEEKTEGVANGGTITFTQTINITDTATLTVKATDTKPSTVQATAATYTYVYPFYHGVVAAVAAPTSDDIVAMVKDVSTKSNKTYTYDLADNCAVIAYPKAYGVLKSVLDANGFDNMASYTQYTVAVTGTDGTAQDYYVYVKEPGTATGFALTYKF